MSPIERGQCHLTLYKFWPNHIFGISEAMRFKFCSLIDTEEY